MTGPTKRIARHPKGAAVAFTLIELLVVIVIISLLAAILFPVFAQARAKARQAVCASNLKQIGLAISLYQQDYDGFYVPKYPCKTFHPIYNDLCVEPSPDDPGVVFWMKSSLAPANEPYLLEPYIKEDTVRLCPSRRRRYLTSEGWQEGRYTLNGWNSYWGEGKKETSPQGQPDAAVPNPATTLIVWEHSINNAECQVGQQGGTPDMPAGTGDHWESNHHNGFNVLWCDGHVKQMRVSELRRTYFSILPDPL